MTVRKALSLFFPALGMLLLILDSKTAMHSALEGVELCIRSVIPALFPFLLCSALLTDALWGCPLPVPKWLMTRLGIPEGAQGILIPAFLGGYPAGAQTIAEAYRSGRLDLQTAEHLLSFCNNAGPSFLFGITASAFSDKTWVWLLWLVHILSALAAGILDNHPAKETVSLPSRHTTFTGQLAATVTVMGIICGWVLLFRIVLGFLDRWVLWLIPQKFHPLIWGLLELSNGCLRLGEIPWESFRFLCCSVMLSAGGLCVGMQTASVIGDLSMKACLRGKLVQTLFSLLLSVLAVGRVWMGFGAMALWILFFPAGRKKAVAFPCNPLYNGAINPGRSEHAVP